MSIERPPIEADPNRFEVARMTLIFDRLMNLIIVAGGIGVIAAVFGIFAFILSQIVPLFGRAEVEERGHVLLGVEEPVAMGVDEWGELPFIFTDDSRLVFADLRTDPVTREVMVGADGELETGPRGIFEVETGLPETIEWTHSRFDAYTGTLLLGSSDGQFSRINIAYSPDFGDGNVRSIKETVSVEQPIRIDNLSGAVVDLDFYSTSTRQLITAIIDTGDRREIIIQPFSARRSLFGPAKMNPDDPINLTAKVEGTPRYVRAGGSGGDRVMVLTEEGAVYYFATRGGSDPVLMQVFHPFADLEGVRIRSVDWLFGRVSLVVTGDDGSNRVFASYLDEEMGKIQYVQIKEFPKFGKGASSFAHSLRNRAFLLAGDNLLSLRYATTEKVRWEARTDYRIELATLGPKYDSIFAYDSDGSLHVFELEDPHPEAGMAAFFGKIWYEGQPEPDYQWQSTGGESSFEPKLSIVPLFFGSLKGTVYAMMFAVPIAILAAVYTSQFLTPEVKKFIKPTMEIMASLPSVVLGFLAALWLSPILVDRVPSVLTMLVLIPTAAIGIGYVWGRLPQGIRMHLKPGREFWVMIPIVLIVGYVGWILGPLVEAVLFGGDFKAWWPEFTGTSYEQRNSLVVGFMVGFAVIPIIFTISEDALSNVPPYLTSASLALGASRWQTAWMVVLPTGSPGIFSALMIGLGRAVGETMIFVMATGNTPVMDYNIFNGMRTLAANIAVELPEAPQHSTLYRTLFLGAMVLFVLTFFVNTVAEVTRQRLREKYKTV